MDRTGSDEGMDATALSGWPNRLSRSLDILLNGPGQPGNTRSIHFTGNAMYSIEIALRSYGEPGFDDIHAKCGQRLSYAYLFPDVHRTTRRLLAISQGRIKNV